MQPKLDGEIKLALIIDDNIAKLVITVNDRDILQQFISNNVNTTLTYFQYTLIKSINKALVEQMAIININIETNIQDSLIKFQTALTIPTQNNS